MGAAQEAIGPSALPPPGPAAPSRRPRGLHRRGASLVAALVFMLAGVLFAASSHTAQGTDLRGGRAVQTRDLAARAAQRVAEQEAVVEALQREVADLIAVGGTGTALAASQRLSGELVMPAGLGAVAGPGLRVVLDDAPKSARGGPGNPTVDDLVVHQQDVQAVVNALRRGGATAVQVMDQRIVATSAVRCVGNTLLLQGRVYSPPFTVIAVGDSEKLTRSLDDDPQVTIYREYVNVFGLGYLVRVEKSVMIPAYTGSLAPVHARPVSPS